MPARGFDVITPGAPADSPAADLIPAARQQPGAAARWGAIVLTSLCFAAIHPGLWMMPPIFFLSLCVGYAYERTGNLWAPITMHAVFNTTSTILYFTFMH
jgi:membrane protease YdiL (CAAX protease family)